MPACSRCGKTLPKTDFTPTQLKAKASVRFCIACTQRYGTLDACFKQAASTAAAERPSQVVHERTLASTPKGQDVTVMMERVSTGGTRHEALYERPQSGPMSGSQRMAKTRARTTLFPDKAAAERAQNTQRMAALRSAECELEAAASAEAEVTDAANECRICASLKKGDFDAAAARLLPEMRVSVQIAGQHKPDETGCVWTEDAEITLEWPYNGSTFSPPLTYTGRLPGDGGTDAPEWEDMFKQLESFIADMLLSDAREEERERLRLEGERERLEHERLERERDQRERANRLRAALVAQREFDVNSLAVISLGLQILNFGTAALPAPVRPAWLSDALASGLVMQARVVDFWSGSGEFRRSLRVWLERIGFDVTVTDDRSQIGAACGYVAGRATGIMYAAGDDWRSINVSDAVEARWIHIGNMLLENGWLSDDYLEVQHVYRLAQLFHEHVLSLPRQSWDIHSQAFPSMSWPLLAGACDWVSRRMVEKVMQYTQRGRVSESPERAFFVTNTQDSRSRGMHWISVAISLSWD